jgi:hypothetical protein
LLWGQLGNLPCKCLAEASADQRAALPAGSGPPWAPGRIRGYRVNDLIGPQCLHDQLLMSELLSALCLLAPEQMPFPHTLRIIAPAGEGSVYKHHPRMVSSWVFQAGSEPRSHLIHSSCSLSWQGLLGRAWGSVGARLNPQRDSMEQRASAWHKGQVPTDRVLWGQACTPQTNHAC